MTSIEGVESEVDIFLMFGFSKAIGMYHRLDYDGIQLIRHANFFQKSGHKKNFTSISTVSIEVKNDLLYTVAYGANDLARFLMIPCNSCQIPGEPYYIFMEKIKCSFD